MNESLAHEEVFLEASKAWEENNLKKAYKLFHKIADLGDSGGQLNLGYFYDEGLHVEQNKSKAIYWYKKAYSQNEGSAANNIAIHYKSIKEYKKALWWFHKAVKLLDHDAYFDIAQLYENGHGVKRNISKAIWFYSKAVQAKHITEDTIEKAKRKLKILKT